MFTDFKITVMIEEVLKKGIRSSEPGKTEDAFQTKKKGEYFMIYRLNIDNYHNFHVFEENKEAPRAYFIPFSDAKKAESAKLL